MSATIDERIVEMKFDNKDFEKNVGTSLNTLEKLQGALKFDNATDSIRKLSQATSNINFNPIATGIENISDRFSAMGIVGMTVIQNLTNAALNFATQWVTTIPEKIISGGWTRAMNIENAHFQLQGLINDEKEVKAVMDQASESVNGTAYSYDSAAKAASMFAATGLKSGKEMENALKAIAGVAATTNADYESISHVFTTVAGNGRLMGEQLNQLSYRGMNAAAALVKYFNGVHDGSIQASDSVKNTVNSIMGSQDQIMKSAEEVKEALEREYEAAQKAYSEEFEAMQKALNKEYKAYQKALNKEYELKKEAYDNEYEALQESLQEELEAQKEANSKRIEEANKAYEDDVENYKKATEEKINLINEEYEESIKLIDEEKYNKLKAIDDEIDAINAASEAEEKERKEQERAAKILELTAAVNSARTVKERQKAQEALDAYNKKVAQERLAEERKERIKELRQQKETVKEDADEQKKAAKEKREEAIDAVNEEYQATMKEMSEKHQEEMEELRKTQEEEMKILQKANKEKLKEFRKSQAEELEAFREAQSEEAEAYREGQQKQLEALRETNNQKLKELKKTQEEQQKAVSSFSTSTQITEAEIRDMVSKGLISFDLFSEAMATTFGDHAKDANKTFTGAMSNIFAALARTGAMFFSPLIEQEGEAVQLFNTIRIKINDMNGELKGFATESTTAINAFIEKLGHAVSKIPIKEITQSATNAARAFANIFKFVGSLIKPIVDAFSEVFFSFDSSNIVKISDAFLNLTKNLKVTVTQSDKIRYLFMEVFNVFKNVFNLIKNFAKGFTSQFEAIEIPIKSIFELITTVRNKLMGFNNLVLQSKETQDAFTNAGKKAADIVNVIVDAFEGFFRIIGSGIGKVTDFVRESEDIQRIFKALKEIISKVGTKISDFFDGIKKSMDDTDTSKLDILREKFGFLEKPLQFIKDVGKKAIKVIADLLEKVNDSIDMDTSGFLSLTTVLEKLEKPIEFLRNVGIGVFETLKKILDPLIGSLKKLGAEIWNILSGTNPLQTLVAFINTKLITGVGANITKFIKTINDLLIGTLLATITDFIAALSQMLGDVNNSGINKFADALKSMAEAVLMLAAACLILSSIDAEGLAKATTAIGALITELTGAYIAMRKFTPKANPLFSFFGGKDGIGAKYGAVGNFGTTILALAAAIGILSVACYGLSKMDTEALVKGIGAVSTLLWELAAVSIVMSKAGGDSVIKGAGGALLGLSVSLLIITKAVKELSSLDMESLVKGIGAVSTLILVLGAFTKMAGGATKMVAVGLGLMATAGAVMLLVSSVEKLAGLDLVSLLQGVGAISGLVLVLGAFTKIAGGSTKLISIGVGLLAVAGAVSIITDAVVRLSDVDPEGLLDSVLALSVLLGDISLCLTLLKPSDAVAALGILETAVAVVAIANALRALDGLNGESLLNSTLSLVAILSTIAICLNTIPPKAAIAGLGAMEMAVTIVAIGHTLKQIGEIPGEAILNSTLALVSILATITLCLMAIPPTAAIAGLGAIEMALSMVAIAMSLKVLSSVPADKILDVTLSMVAILAAMSLCLIAIPPTAVLGGLAAIEMAASMLLIAKSLKEMAGIDSKSMVTALLGLLSALTILTTVSTVLGAIAPVVLAGAAVLFAMAASLSGSAQILAPALYSIADAIEYWGKLKPEAFSKSIEMIGKALEVIGKGLKNFGILAKGSAEALKTTAEGLNVLAPAMMIFMSINGPKLKKTFDTVGYGISEFGKALKKFGIFSEIGAGALENVAKAISTMAPALVMLSTANPKKLAAEMETLGNGFAKFGESLESYDIFSGIGANAIKTIADAINVLTPSLMMLQVVDPMKTSIILTTIGNAFKAFGEALDATPFWGTEKRANGITLLVEDVKLLADSLPALTDLDANSLSTVLGAIGSAFKDFGTALSNAPFWNPEDRGEAIGILVQEIKDLAEVLPAFMELDAGAAKTALITIGNAFMKFGKALDATPFFNVESRGEAIKILVGSIEELANGLNTFINYNFDGKAVEDAITHISTGFTKFGKSLKSAPFWNPEDKGEAIKILVSSVKSLAMGLEYFIGHVDGEKAKDAISTISTAFTDFAKALKSTPWFNVKDRTKGIVALITNLNNLTDGVAGFISKTEGKEEIAQSVLGTIGTALKDFGTAIKNSPFWGTEKRADALVSVIDNLNGIADVVERLSSIGTAEQIALYLGGISSMVKQLGTGVKEFKGISKSTIDNLKTILTIVSDFASVDATSLSSALSEFLKLPSIVASLSAINFSILSTIRNELLGFMTDMTIVSTGIGVVIAKITTEISLAKAKLQNAGKGMAEGVLNGMLLVQVQFSKAGTTLASSITSSFLMYSSKAMAAGVSFAQVLNKGIDSFKRIFQTTGSNLAITFVTAFSAPAMVTKATKAGNTIANSTLTGLSLYLGMFSDIGRRIAEVFVEAIRSIGNECESATRELADKAYNGVSSTERKFEAAGRYAVYGFVSALRNGVDDAYDAGWRLGNAAYDAARRALDEHSPSRKMAEIGDFAGIGFVKAFSSYISDSEDTGEDLGLSAMLGLKDAIAKNMDIPDFSNPTITPILDLTNVEKGVDSLNSILKPNRTIDLASNVDFDVNKANVVGDLMGSLVDSTTSGDEMIIDSIQGLRSDLYELSKVVGNLKVVMDSGTLVGAIAPNMDQALGQMATMKRRGV